MTTRRQIGRRSSRRTADKYEYSATMEMAHMRAVPATLPVRATKVLAALFLALCATGIFFVFTSSAFFVDESNVSIEGNIVVPAGEIFTASQIDGTSIFWVNADAVEERLMAMPNVRLAWVRVRLPTRVVISVEERLPALKWQAGDTTWWVDAEGTIIEPRTELPDALTVVDADSRPARAGQQLDESTLAAIRQLHVLLPELDEIRYSADSGVGFLTAEGWPVYLGHDDKDMQAKLTVLVTLRRQLLAGHVTPQFINLEQVSSPYYR